MTIEDGCDLETKDCCSRKMPGAVKVASNLLSSGGKITASGGKKVSTETFELRVSTCESCPNFEPRERRCFLCGCYVDLKAKWEALDCPDSPSRWNF